MTPTRAPIPYDPAAGDRAVAQTAPPSDWAEVVRGAAGSSPYLAGLLRRESAWLLDLWDTDLAHGLVEVIDGVEAVEGDPKMPLRVAKRRVALLLALLDLGGVWDTMRVCAALTRFADAALSRCLAFALGREKNLPFEPGLAIFAMGKMGAGELNYSSDVDLILLYDQDRYAPDGYAAARAGLIRAARSMVAQMSDITADGYVFRTDLRLRPDPASTPVVQSMEAAERYYEAMGRTWERAAWIKARPAAGDVVAGERFQLALRPFVWRRHLDFVAVQEAHDMRLAIRSARRMPGGWEVPGHDLKLGRGGIREIEFFAQTRQLIAGGRDPSLRARATLDALDALVTAGWVGADDATALAGRYRRLRDLEHRAQMIRDAQTHAVPRDREELRRMGYLCGEPDVDAFVARIGEDLRAVDAITSPFFQHGSSPPPPTDEAQVPDAEEVTSRWPSYPAMRSERARATFARLRPTLMARLAEVARPREALDAFDRFLAGLPAGAQLFALFEANPKLVDLIVDVCAVAPSLARFLSGHAAVLDAVLDGSFFAPLAEGVEPPPVGHDYESALDALRRWHGEHHFRIGVHLLRGLATAAEAGRAYAQLAETTVAAAFELARAETVRRYGAVSGLHLCVLGMGSLGARCLNARSDLDLVVVHDGGTGPSDGRQALAPTQWAARFTQILVTTLSAPTGSGRLYEVDMRLRPSGRSGPVAVGLAGWQSYQEREAWAWEHLALIRARTVAGDGQLCERVERTRRAILRTSRFPASELLSELEAMFARLRAAKPGSGGLAVRHGAGRAQEIELAAQAHALIAGVAATGLDEQLAGKGWLDADEREMLVRSHATFAAVGQGVRLLSASDPPVIEGQGGARFVASLAGQSGIAAAAAACDAAADEADAAIARAVARGAG